MPTEATAPATRPRRRRRPGPVGPTDLGDVLVDEGGLTLYGFTKDADGAPDLRGRLRRRLAAAARRQRRAPGRPRPRVFTVVERADGAFQLKAGKWPLYRFAGDAAAGETNGQASGGVWFVVDPSEG